MSGYGTTSWTCGKCGESYSSSGVVGDLRVDRWAREHRAMHERREARLASAATERAPSDRDLE